MPNLFDDHPPPSAGEHRDFGAIPTERIASPALDPATSKLAAESHKASGRLNHNCSVVLKLVRANPGCTSCEIHERQTATNLDRTEVSRRLADLATMGYAEQGIKRKCEVKGTLMVTWRARDFVEGAAPV